MAEEVAQSYGGGEIKVATVELNPVLKHVYFDPPADIEPVSYLLKDQVKIENQVLDLELSWKDGVKHLGATATNEGDEVITMRCIIEIDGVEVFNKEATVEPDPTAPPSGWYVAGDPAWVTTGKHNIAWKLYAQEGSSIGPSAQLYVDDIVDYYCYTLPLDAIATEVVVVQGETEKHWLSGTPEGFTESEVSIKPDTETYFKFKLKNNGDEPVKMNVGHKVNSTYETGFLVGGVLVDTIDKDVEILAGETGEIKTETFTASGAQETSLLTIGALAVLRLRILPVASSTMILEDSSGSEYGNLVSVPVFDPRPIVEILDPGKYSSLYVIYRFNANTQKWETCPWDKPFEPGVGYAIPCGQHIEEALSGPEYKITAEALIASLQTGFNLIGVGIEQVDISATGLTATYYLPDGTKLEGITLLEQGKAYFIEK